MRKLTKLTVTILLDSFDQTTKAIERAQEQIQKQMQENLAKPVILDADEDSGLLEQMTAVSSMLKDYTSGFPSYLRSVGKTPLEKRPDEAFLNQVRELLQRARDIENEFDWLLDHYKQQVTLHNMALGHFASSGTDSDSGTDKTLVADTDSTETEPDSSLNADSADTDETN